MSFDDLAQRTKVTPAAVHDRGRASPPAGVPATPSDDGAGLMARIAAGDQAAFADFAQRHVARSLAVAQRIIGNASDAEEIVQDGLLRVWQRAADWRQADARVTTWLYRIVVNLAIDRARKIRHRYVSIDEAGDPMDPAPTAQMIVEQRQLQAFMNAAIAELPERQRVALTLCCFEAMDCAEAAAVMQISVSAMESLLVRGRRTLRWRLSRIGSDEEHGRSLRTPQSEGNSRSSAATTSLGFLDRGLTQSFA